MSIVLPTSVVSAIVVAAAVGPFFLQDPNKNDLRNAKAPILSDGHLLGTDAFGRDMLARVVEGARVSLLVGFVSVGACIVIGGVIGLLAGYRRGAVDAMMMRAMDMMLAFPTLILALAIAAFLGPSVRNVIFAVAFSQLPHYARVARATTLSVRERDFVLGSKLLGARDRHIVTRHIVPNIIAPLSTYGLVSLSVAIVIEASLSFLGLGVRPPTPSWGAMIAESRQYLKDSPHIALVPGVALFVTTFSLNLAADGIRSRSGGH